MWRKTLFTTFTAKKWWRAGLAEDFSHVSRGSASTHDWQSLVRTLVSQEEGPQASASLVCGATARGHECVVGSSSAEGSHCFAL